MFDNKRAERRALRRLFDAYLTLKELGWKDPLSFYFPKVGQPFQVIELGSIGIHEAVQRNEGDSTVWLEGNLPSRPALIRAFPLEKPNG